MTHTPTPWIHDPQSDCILDDHGGKVIVSPHESDHDIEVDTANASHIVKCVNAHDDLVSALQLVTISAAWHNLTENTRVIISTALAKAGAA